MTEKTITGHEYIHIIGNNLKFVYKPSSPEVNFILQGIKIDPEFIVKNKYLIDLIYNENEQVIGANDYAVDIFYALLEYSKTEIFLDKIIIPIIVDAESTMNKY